MISCCWAAGSRAGERGKEEGAAGEEMLEMFRELERKELLVVETNCATFSPGGDEAVPVVTEGVSIQLNGGQLTEAETGGEGAGKENGLLFLTTIACCDSPVTPDTTPTALCMRTC